MGWLKSAWLWIVPGVIAGLGILWKIFRPTPKPAVPIVTEEQRENRHKKINKDLEERNEAWTAEIEAERGAALDLLDDTD